MGKFLVAFLTAGLVAAAPASNTQDRQEFETLIKSLAAQGELSCSEIATNHEPKNLNYTLSVEDEPNYRDAFMLRFMSGEINWSTLVAYEGYNGHIMGRLDKSEEGGETIYKHVFDGYYDDNLILNTVSGKVVELTYFKLAPGGVIHYRVSCTPVITK